MQYQEFLPHPALRKYILLYGILEDPVVTSIKKIEKTPPIINKGLMFHYRRDTTLWVDNGCHNKELPRGFVLPQGTTPNVWYHYGGFGIFAITFQPGKFCRFFPDSMLEYLNHALTFEDFNDKRLLELYEQIMTAPSHSERIRHANAFFLKKLSNIHDHQDCLQHALQLMLSNPTLKLNEFVRSTLGMTDRHFRRIFAREFGIAPKKLQQLIRLTNVINHLNSGNIISLTDLAYQNGFYDQAHFINCFRHYTGMTPSAFLKQDGLITKYINYHEEVWDWGAVG